MALDEAEDLFAETLANSFGLPMALVYDTNLSTFKQWLDRKDLPALKLDMLSQFIFNEIDLKNEVRNNQILAQKLNLIYQTLARSTTQYTLFI